MVLVLRSRATKEQMQTMLQALGTYVKLAVDVRRGSLAGGGVLHADCESALLQDGSGPDDIWGADWHPLAQRATFEALINIRPRLNNRSMVILDPTIRERVAQIVQSLLGGP